MMQTGYESVGSVWFTLVGFPLLNQFDALIRRIEHSLLLKRRCSTNLEQQNLPGDYHEDIADRCRLIAYGKLPRELRVRV